MITLFRSTVSLIAVTGLASAALAAPPRYDAVDIGTLGGPFVYANQLNERGEVAGYSNKFAGDSGRAFVWRDGVMTDLSPHVGESSNAIGINDHGHIVGVGTSGYFLYDGELQVLPFTAFELNNAGRVIGTVNTDIGFSVAYQDRGGTVQIVPTFGGPEAAAGDVNEAGVIVGAADVALRGLPHAFLWDGTLHDLGTLGGTTSGAGAINDHGHVVGWSHTADETMEHAFFYDGTTMHDLGTFGGDRGGAGDINNLGQIVGSGYRSGQNGEPGVSHPILYEDGIAYDLNDLIASEPGRVLEVPIAINDLGQILALGTLNGDRRFYFLTPVPEPSVLASGGIAAIFLATRRRRRHDTRSRSRASA